MGEREDQRQRERRGDGADESDRSVESASLVCSRREVADQGEGFERALDPLTPLSRFAGGVAIPESRGKLLLVPV